MRLYAKKHLYDIRQAALGIIKDELPILYHEVSEMLEVG